MFPEPGQQIARDRIARRRHDAANHALVREAHLRDGATPHSTFHVTAHALGRLLHLLKPTDAVETIGCSRANAR